MTTHKAEKAAKVKHKAKIELASKRKPKIRLLKFSASNCGPCEMMEPVLELFAMRNKDIRVVKYMIDGPDAGKDERVLGEEILSVPTMVFMLGKAQLHRVEGAVGIRALENAAVKAREAAGRA